MSPHLASQAATSVNELGRHAAIWRQSRPGKNTVLASQSTDLLLLLVDVSLHPLELAEIRALSCSDISVCCSLLRSCRNFSLSKCTRPCGTGLFAFGCDPSKPAAGRTRAAAVPNGKFQHTRAIRYLHPRRTAVFTLVTASAERSSCSSSQCRCMSSKMAELIIVVCNK